MLGTMSFYMVMTSMFGDISSLVDAADFIFLKS